MIRVIAGSARGRRLKTPRGKQTRPTADRVKETLFNILGPRVKQARVLDLFAGAGGLGIEALSRGAEHALFVERDRQVALIIWENLTLTGLAEQAEVWAENSRRALQRLTSLQRRFDLVFLDPPYGRGLCSETVNRLAQVGLVVPGGGVVVEHDRQESPLALPAQWTLLSERIFGDTVVTCLEHR